MPRLWPRERWSRVALLLVMAFAFFQAVLVGSTVPPWWGPDEDYHWGYVSHINERGSLPNPRKPFYSKEWNAAIIAMDFNQFGQSPGTKLRGNPHRVTGKLDRLPASARQPTGEPTRPVMHAPLFHSVTAVVVEPFARKSVFTRLWIARMVNALFAMLAVYAAWLLASTVFTRAGPQLFVGGLTAVQPMIAYASGTLTNDMPTIAFFTLAFAAMSFMLTSAPDRRQGRMLGTFLALAVLTKSTAIFLVPFSIAVYLYQWRKHPVARREIRASLAWAGGIPLVFAGWFYAFLLLKYNSLLGNLGPLNTAISPAPQSITELPSMAVRWFSQTYSTYWSHYVYWEGPRSSPWFWVPVMLGTMGALGLAAAVWRIVATRAFDPPRMRQMTLFVAAVTLLVAPFFLIDMMRGLDGNGFMVNGGRFMLPAYPVAAVLFTIGIAELFRPELHRFVFATVGGLAAVQGLAIWKMKTLDRYFGGPTAENLQSELHRASFFRPDFVTNETLTALIALVLAIGVAAFLAILREDRGLIIRVGARWRGRTMPAVNYQVPPQ